MTDPRESEPGAPTKPPRRSLDEGKTRIHAVKRSLRTEDVVASILGLAVGVAAVLFLWPTGDRIAPSGGEVTTADAARSALCDLYVRRDKKASYRYQREEYLLSEIRDGNRSRIDFGTLVNQLAKDTWDSVRLIGEVGVGKSTMVKRIASRICVDTPVQVIRVNLDELPLIGSPTARQALGMIAEHTELPAETIRLLRRSRLVLLIDGIDRLPYERHAAAAAVIKAFVKPAVDARLVLVSKRAINFYQTLDQAEWIVFELPPLTAKESLAYLRTKAKAQAEFDSLAVWLAEMKLDEMFTQPGLGTPSSVYLSTYDDAKTVWEIYQEQPRAVETSWSMADLYHRFILRSVKARDEQLPTLAKVQGWLDDATPEAEPDVAGDKKRMEWTTARCEVAATKHGLPDPSAHCEQLFARAKGGLQFSKCANKEDCWTLYYRPHDDLFRARRLARRVGALRSCERVRDELELGVRERAAMLVGQPQVRQLCLPLLLESLCQSMGSPEPVASHIRKGFPRGAQVRAEALSRFENEPSLSGCARQVIKRLMQ